MATLNNTLLLPMQIQARRCNAMDAEPLPACLCINSPGCESHNCILFGRRSPRILSMVVRNLSAGMPAGSVDEGGNMSPKVHSSQNYTTMVLRSIFLRSPAATEMRKLCILGRFRQQSPSCFYCSIRCGWYFISSLMRRNVFWCLLPLGRDLQGERPPICWNGSLSKAKQQGRQFHHSAFALSLMSQ